MDFDFGAFAIDVDVERTRKYYRDISRTLTEGCGCILCQNFLAAYETLDPQIRQFFDSLGVNICKAADMTSMHGDQKRNILYYEGFCHLCGKISAGGMEDHKTLLKTAEYPVAAGCTVAFSTRCALVEKSFPAPVLQLEVRLEVPWVMGGNFTDVLKW